jgi:hypothetical protein
MGVQENRLFRLSQPAGVSGISCDATGAFVDDIPLLKRSDEAAGSIWIPRPSDELSEEFGARYGLPIDLSSRVGGLNAIARALNADDIALAQIATVQFAIPEPRSLSKDASSRQAFQQFICDLSANGLLKSDWDSDEHPRWPAGSADSQGGQFAPKGEGQADDSDAENASFGGEARVREDAAVSNTTPTASEVGEHSDAAPIPAVERGEDNDLFDPVVYRGYFHDEIVGGLAQRFRDKGWEAETEITIAMADGSGSTRIDLLVKGPNTPVVGFEVKTGEDPPFTKSQLYVYPHLIMGGSVIAPYGNVYALGLPSNVPLPPIPVFLFYVRDSNSKQDIEPLSSFRLLAEYLRRFGRVRKCTPQQPSIDEIPKMSESDFAEHEKEAIMIANAYGGRNLASREIALAMAEMLVRENHGDEHLKTQAPLQIYDKGESWLIEGSRRGEDHPVTHLGLHQDKVIIEIRKRDCQVLNFARMAF